MNPTLSTVRRRLNFDVSPELPVNPPIFSNLSTSPSTPMDISTSPSISLDLPVAPSNSSELPATTTPPRNFSTIPSIPRAPRKKNPTTSRVAKLRRVPRCLDLTKLENIKEEEEQHQQQQQNSTALSLWIHRKYNQDYIVKELAFQKGFAKYLRENGLSDFPDVEKVDLKMN